MAACQNRQPVQRDATGKTMLMNSRRGAVPEALTFALTDLYFFSEIFLVTSGVTGR